MLGSMPKRTDLRISIEELGWPLREADLGLLWQMPNLPAEFLERDLTMRSRHTPLPPKLYLVTASRDSPNKDSVHHGQITAAVACRVPPTGLARVWAPYSPTEDLEAVACVLGTAASLAKATSDDANHSPAPKPGRTIAVANCDDTAFHEQLRCGGFIQTCRTLHLLDADQGAAETAWPDLSSRTERIKIRPVHENERELFFQLIEQTYVQTEDCAVLESQHTIDEVRRRWAQTTSEERKQGWFVASVEGTSRKNVGCLILRLPVQSINAELVYMGLIPTERRKGFGRQLVSIARRLKKENKRETLTVSVDSANEAALQCYIANGFVHYAESLIFLNE